MTTSITGSARTNILDKVDAIRHHLEGLTALADQLPADPDEETMRCAGENELVLFARWMLDLLGMAESEGDLVAKVRRARPLLVAAMASAPPREAAAEDDGPGFYAVGPHEFEDLFDHEPREQRELTIEPIEGI